MKRLLSFALIAVTTLAAGACGELGTGPATFSGTYALQSINGQRVPAPLYYSSASDHIEILASDLTLYDDGSYTDFTRVQDTHFAPTRVYDDNTQGTWVVSGTQLTLADRNDLTHVTYATLSNGRIVIDRFGGYNARAEYVR